jgi:Fe2+ transport system protein FeoA
MAIDPKEFDPKQFDNENSSHHHRILISLSMRGAMTMPFDRTNPATLANAPATLANAKIGAHVRIVGVSAMAGVERRLTELGLPRGAEVVVTGRMGRQGAMIVAAHGTRLVVGYDMAQAITIASLSA